MLRTAILHLLLTGIPRFNTIGHPTALEACYKAHWRLPWPDFHWQADNSLQNTRLTSVRVCPCWANKSKPTRENNTLWAHVIDVQIYSRSRRHSQYSLEDPVQSAISYATYLYDYESLFSNRNHNPLSKPNR